MWGHFGSLKLSPCSLVTFQVLSQRVTDPFLRVVEIWFNWPWVQGSFPLSKRGKKGVLRTREKPRAVLVLFFETLAEKSPPNGCAAIAICGLSRKWKWTGNHKPVARVSKVWRKPWCKTTPLFHFHFCCFWVESGVIIYLKCASWIFAPCRNLWDLVI